MIQIILILLAVFLFFAFPKQMFLTAGVVVAVVMVLIIQSNNESKEGQRKQDMVRVSVSYNIFACEEEYPLLVLISNNSKETVNKVSWYLEVRKPGYSSNLVSRSYDNYVSDKILRSGENFQVCYRVPDLNASISPDKLEYGISSKYVDFVRGN